MRAEAFRHSIKLRVRNYEVDWQGIVHNAVYLLYFEVGRIEYLRALGLKLEVGSVQSESRVVLVRNEIDYRSTAKFDDLLEIRTRVSSIRKTSFTFEGMMREAGSGRLIAENVAVHVWLHPTTGEPIRVKDEFRQRVAQYEGAGRRKRIRRSSKK